MKRSTVAIKYLHALDLKNFELLSTLRSIMVFMELVYMVLNSDANWLNNSDECYKLKCNYGNARTT